MKSGTLLRSLVAILIGNAIYFLLLTPVLPAAGRHRPFQLDLGLVLDFWICVAIYGAIGLLWQRRRR